jgi:hypothetical protein
MTCWRKQKGSRESREEDEEMTHGLLEEEGSTETREGQDEQIADGLLEEAERKQGKPEKIQDEQVAEGNGRKSKACWCSSSITGMDCYLLCVIEKLVCVSRISV